MNKTWLIIIGMMVVTYIPRLLPHYVLDKMNLTENMKRSLGYIPYAALGALVIPDGFTAITGHPIISTMTLIVALIVGLLKENIFLTVMSSVAFAYGCLYIL